MAEMLLPLAVLVAVIAFLAVNIRGWIRQNPLERRWTPIEEPDPGAEYLAVATHYPLDSSAQINRVLAYVRLIQRKLSRTEGLIGYALRADFYRYRLWTVSVWRDRDALEAFLADDVHQQAQEDLAIEFEGVQIRAWPITGRDVPPDWDQVYERLDGTEEADDLASQLEAAAQTGPPS